MISIEQKCNSIEEEKFDENTLEFTVGTSYDASFNLSESTLHGVAYYY